jgi:hypothetical protein
MLDLFSGRWGWSKSFSKRGWECVGVDLVRPPEIPNGCAFIQGDILGLTSAFACREKFDFICASPPCEQFSVHGMKHFHPNPKYPELGIKLFEHTRRICEESGVPYVIENVRAAQQFVGNAVHHCGPFYLWGTGVPALIPRSIGKGMNRCMARDESTGKRILAGGRAFSSKSQGRKDETAKAATIPPELANTVCTYAEGLLRQRAEVQA